MIKVEKVEKKQKKQPNENLLQKINRKYKKIKIFI